MNSSESFSFWMGLFIGALFAIIVSTIGFSVALDQSPESEVDWTVTSTMGQITGNEGAQQG
jgi:hypothetical protein